MTGIIESGLTPQIKKLAYDVRFLSVHSQITRHRLPRHIIG